MMEWYQFISFFCTNGIRIFLGLCLVGKLLGFPKMQKKSALYSLIGAGMVTALSRFSLSQFYLIGIEIFVLFAITHLLFEENPRRRLFLIFFYEIGVALWEFLSSAGLGILFQSPKFLAPTAMEHMAAVWLVRLLMLGLAALSLRGNQAKNQSQSVVRIAADIAILGLFGVVALSGQSISFLSDDLITTWMILSLVLTFAVMFFELNRQYEMEKEILQLKEDQAELLERDYQALNRTYTTNAKLYHDLHNHLEVLHRYLAQGEAQEAIQYLEDLRAPIQEISQTAWTGDEALDYLINSKLSLAEQMKIATKANIEFPRNTTIRSADLTAILGNLLDNALEAAQQNKADLRFIHLTIRRINNMLIIKVENGCEAPPSVDKGEIQSTKQDKRLHGWGLKSVRTAVERYDGIIETKFEHRAFCAVASLFYDVLTMK